MSDLHNRIKKLEVKRKPADATRTVCVYAHEHTSEEMEAMRKDETIGTLIIVEYAADNPITSVEWLRSGVKKYIGVDVGQL